MEARFGVHWWRFSTATADVDEVLDSITGVSGGDFGPSESRGAFNQPRRFLHTSGASVYFGSSVESQPIVIEVPGFQPINNREAEQFTADLHSKPISARRKAPFGSSVTKPSVQEALRRR